MERGQETAGVGVARAGRVHGRHREAGNVDGWAGAASQQAAAWPEETGPPFGVRVPLCETSYEVAPLISPPPRVVAENRMWP